MPSLFLPALQPRLQAAPILSAVKPSPHFSPVLSVARARTSKRSQRQTHVCPAAGKDEKFDVDDYISAEVGTGTYRAGSLRSCFRQGHGFTTASLTLPKTCSAPTSTKRSSYMSEDRFEGLDTSSLCRCAFQTALQRLPHERTLPHGCIALIQVIQRRELCLAASPAIQRYVLCANVGWMMLHIQALPICVAAIVCATSDPYNMSSCRKVCSALCREHPYCGSADTTDMDSYLDLVHPALLPSASPSNSRTICSFSSLVYGMVCLQQRPLTHDLMKSSLGITGYKVSLCLLMRCSQYL